jgi:hypothetical protein
LIVATVRYCCEFAAEIIACVPATGVWPPFPDAVWSLMSVAAAAVTPVPLAWYFAARRTLFGALVGVHADHSRAP